MKALLTILCVLLAFVVGVFAEHHIGLIHRVVKHGAVVSVPFPAKSKAKPTKCTCQPGKCTCCDACVGKGGKGECQCGVWDGCDCCPGCKGQK